MLFLRQIKLVKQHIFSYAYNAFFIIVAVLKFAGHPNVSAYEYIVHFY